MYITGGIAECGYALVRIVSVTSILLLVYVAGGILAGDVKLLGLCAGCLSMDDVVKYIIVVFYLAAFIGVVKMFYQKIIENRAPKKTTIKFSVPIFLGYIIWFLSKGGI